MPVKRIEGNPVITPEMVKPSQKGYRVEGTSNAGVIDHNGEMIALVRVAESIISSTPDELQVPILENSSGKWEVRTKTFSRNDSRYDFSDSREIVLRENPRNIFLTSLSHIRLARSVNGPNFEIDDTPFIFPDNRDVCLFPEKINEYYWALHRPAPMHFGTPEIWIAKSPDLIHWGDHQRLLDCSSHAWDKMKIAGGAPMIKTDKGWLQIYHGVDHTQRYCLGAILVDLKDPTNVIARLPNPLIEPKTQHEVEGFFGNVVFSCGDIIRDQILHIYYGAADQYLSLATIPLDDLWEHMSV